MKTDILNSKTVSAKNELLNAQEQTPYRQLIGQLTELYRDQDRI